MSSCRWPPRRSTPPARPVSTLTLDGLLAGARAAVIVGSGGPAFFDRFASGSPESVDGAPNPLDRFTKRVADAVVARRRWRRSRPRTRSTSRSTERSR